MLEGYLFMLHTKGQVAVMLHCHSIDSNTMGVKKCLFLQFFQKLVNHVLSQLIHVLDNGFVYNPLLATLVVDYVTRTH